MAESTSNVNASTARASGDNEEEADDLATILTYLIRSGQVRVSSGDREEDLITDESDEDYLEAVDPPSGDPNPDTKVLDESELKQEIMACSGLDFSQGPCSKSSITKMVQMREVGCASKRHPHFSSARCCNIRSYYLPNSSQPLVRYHHKAFCGVYSSSGDIFLTACQDRLIRVYDTKRDNFNEMKSIPARDVGWSILDTAFSPDGNYLAYSSWSDSIHLCNIYGDHEVHNSLPLFPIGQVSFAIFSVQFSSDNTEIMGGANDGHLYIYNREANERILRVDAHEDDVNAICFADSSSQILFSGGDDGLVHVWDRRMLSEVNPNPVGSFSGHMDGITYIDTRGDGRYLLSNCKDQTIKLWDMRKFSNMDGQLATKKEVSRQHWDYRWQKVPAQVYKSRAQLEGDTSLMTYRGHSVLHTLVRARFSPAHTTGQRFIYSGCATGALVVYDILTGQIVKKLKGHRSCVRDVSWHPYDNTIMSTSWDGSVVQWRYRMGHDNNKRSHDSDEDEGCDVEPRRRSPRLRNQTLSLRNRQAFF